MPWQPASQLRHVWSSIFSGALCIEVRTGVLLTENNQSLPGYDPMYNDFREPQMRIEEAEVPGLEESVRYDVHPLTVLNAQL